MYRDDSYLDRFTATVTAAEPVSAGLFAVELDRTLFYPTGGGQPHDTGRLAGKPVVDVHEGGDGRILHLVSAESPPSGEVAGEIDWVRRFDHMQQHTGQHILSRAFVEMAGAATKSFHLGEGLCTIDIDRTELDAAMARSVEARTNEIVFSDPPVEVDLIDAARAPQLAADMNLARDLALKPGDPIRMVRVGRFDETPCGGTHVRRAGEVGAVAIRRWERFKGGTRVAFVCGGRVVRVMRELGEVVDACVARLSVQPAELPLALDRIQDQLGETRRTVKALNEALVGAEAMAREASARPVGACRVLVELFAGRPAEDLQLLARKYVEAGSRFALLAATDPDAGKTTLVFARSAAGVPAEMSMGEILSAICGAHGGKGGGGAALARGGGMPAGEAGICLEEAFQVISSRLLA
jgi:alanyl-tRNA synthetase